ncbi:hypothetical protein V8F33_008752 [Rhypophila sp. PSN 637]
MPGQTLIMRCWNSTTNPPGKGNDTLALIERMYAIASSSNEVEKNEVEICVCYPAGSGLPDISAILNEEAKGYRYNSFVAQESGFEAQFTYEEMNNLKATASRENEAGQDCLPSLLINSAQLEGLRNIEGDHIQNCLKDILKAPGPAVKLPKSAWQTVWMIAKGAWSLVGGASAAGYLITWLGSKLQAMAAVAMGLPLLVKGAALVAIFTTILFALKECCNILLVVNNTKSDVTFLHDKAKNGDRTSYTKEIPSTAGKMDGYHAAGWYFYDKNKIGGYTIGFFGSAFGAAWSCGERKFAIGMDCPNTIMGGSNSIEIHQDDNASKACEASGCVSVSVSGPLGPHAPL